MRRSLSETARFCILGHNVTMFFGLFSDFGSRFDTLGLSEGGPGVFVK